MKYTAILIFALAAVSATASTPERLALPAGAHHPVLSPDGSHLLYTTDSHSGLSVYSMADGTSHLIDSSAAAGFAPVFTADGSAVIYRTASYDDGLLYRDVRSSDLTGEHRQRLAAPSRNDVNISPLTGNSYAYADYRTIRVCRGAAEEQLSPLPEAHSYLWASLSPDGSRLLFTEPFEGVFVANADGSQPRRILAKGDYPCWAGDGTVVAVVSHDDGYVILDSQLVSVDLTSGTVTELTDSSVKVSEATATDGMVVFSDINGNMFTLKL